MSYEKVKLSELAGGAAEDFFNHELENVFENIQDVNTDATTKRTILLKIEINPTEDRQFGGVDVSCVSKLAGKKPAQAQFAFSDDGVFENRLKQGNLGLDENVTRPDFKSLAAGEGRDD